MRGLARAFGRRGLGSELPCLRIAVTRNGLLAGRAQVGQTNWTWGEEKHQSLVSRPYSARASLSAIY